MAPKQAKSGGRGRAEEAKEDPLQAVVVYFYAGAHIEQVEAYVKASKWMSSASPFLRVEMIRCMATSVGDIMRDLDQKQIINGDFICVSGDIVSDFPVNKALKVHKQRREKDKNAIMTMLLRERNDSDHRHRNQTVPTFVIDPTNDRCLHYEESLAGAPFGTHIDPEMLKSPEIDVRQDLIDCRIDICTPDVLSLWSDNFDNNHPRREFLFGVLKDYELNGKTIHTYHINGYYANRVDGPTAYATITYDLRHGVASSLALTNNVSGTCFRRLRNDISKEDGVIIHRPARLAHGTLVGEGSSIGAGTNLRRTIVGRRCQIGKKTEIHSAIIWDDVAIGSNVKLSRAIIGSEAYIGDNVTIEEGVLVSFGASIPSGTHVSAGKRVTAQSTFGMNGIQPEEDAYDSDEEEEDDESQWARSFYQQAGFNNSTSSLASDVSEASDQMSGSGSRSQSFATHASDDDGTERFVHDTAAILVQRMQEGRHADDMQSELMGLRFSGGADGTMVQKAVATALTKHIHAEVSGGVSPQEATRRTLEQYRFLIRRQNAEQTTEEQVVFLLEAQSDLSKRTDGSRIVPLFVKDLYDLDVLEEEAFTEWYEDERSQEEAVAPMRDAAKPFIDWLATADEEESEDEDEDEDGEDDDSSDE
ncbi:translation initiation factor eIF-2B epsilon subunit, GEF [Exophiala xenobiotica]|uniref:Translation initiation factor eIF2B subunit epsilon n=1 Tax=Lithohypha guttulata TaxID=1690604 RepID=A0ABR0K361_9EURO|nr:translation initiation factor eIF-2B epsilon subunit, GEF [Lithohypha guttulata]KAK5326132.1 translation initiation factor eIF-2B epsilon subunit, GEF [Exophiala xenobiotica]